ncbi:copper resistance CopC/CopD family protein [Roseiflexus sp.]|uniref:copper resistance CopC/CopD family protein n=1 Tax=Roseiflexus sp. TaxID=2562120 RepID=UPI00398B2A3E
MFRQRARSYQPVWHLLRRSPIGAVVLVLMLLSAPAAYAHPQIVSVEPAPDAQIDAAPPLVRITFNEPIEEAFAAVQVLDATGRAVDRGDGGRAPDDPLALQVRLPPLDPGVYTVAWQAVGRDGHLVKGYFAFTILGAPPDAAAPALQLSADPPPLNDSPETSPIPPEAGSTPLVDLLALLRSVMLIGAVTAVGGWVFLWTALTSGSGRLAESIRRIIAGALLLVLIATLAFFAVHTIAVAGVLTADTITAVARDTRLGQALVGRMAFILIFIGLMRFSNQWSRTAGMVIGGLILLTFSIGGHAAATAQPLVSVALDWMHLAAATNWAGGLTALVVALIRRNDDTPDLHLVKHALMRFSWLALASVAVLTISGVFAALSYLRDVSDLWVTDYGRTLLIKTALFALLISLGAYHLRLVRMHTTVLDRATTVTIAVMQRLRRSLPLEAALAIIVVGVAGVLTSLPHPAAAPVRPSIVAAPDVVPEPTGAVAEKTAAPEEPTSLPTPQPFTAIRAAGDLQVALHIEPAAIGRNLMRITITDTQNQPRDVQRVRVMLRLNDKDIGETYVIASPDGPGEYVVRDQTIGIAGMWQVQVQVRRIDADDVTADFLFAISR